MGKSASHSGHNIAKMKDIEDIDGLNKAATQDGNRVVRIEAMFALASIGDTACLQSLCQGLSDGDAEVRKAAAWSLGKMGHAQAINPLLQAVRDSDAGVRAAAAKALGFVGDSQAVDVITFTALTDKKKLVRQTAEQAIKKIEERIGIPKEETDALLSQAQEILSVQNKQIDEQESMTSLMEPQKRYLALLESENCSQCKTFYTSPNKCPFNRDLRRDCLSFDKIEENERQSFLQKPF